MEDKIILDKTLQIEKQIAGLWYNPANMFTWQFSQIEEKDRIGNVLIADRNKPVGAIFLRYEVIWVNDDKVFIDLIYSTIGVKYQHQIWVTDKSLKIAHTNPTTQEIEYLILNKA